LSKERRPLLSGNPLRTACAVIALVSLVFAAGVLADATPAAARIFNVAIVDRSSSNFHDGDFDLSDAISFPLTPSDGIVGNSGFSLDTFFAPVGSTVWIGVSTEDAGSITADSDSFGTFTQALCNDNNNNGQDFEEPADACVNMVGLSTSQLIIPNTGNSFDHQPPALLPRMGLAIAYKCPAITGTTHIVIGQGTSIFDFFMVCHGFLARTSIAATSTQLEILPQFGSTDHSLLRLDLFDANGGIVAGYEVDWSVDRCGIETDAVDTVDEVIAVLGGAVDITETVGPDGTSPQLDEARNLVFDFNGDGRLDALSMAIVHCEPGHSPTLDPGVIHVTARATRPGSPTVVTTFVLNLLGPPNKIILSAAPTSVRCGEKVTATAVVVDAINQTVSDNTPVEYVVNLGGTGTAARIFGPIAPISSGVGPTTKGVSTFFLLTSTANVGTYEIVASADGLPNQARITATTSVSCFVPPGETPSPAAAAPAPTVVAPAGSTTAGAAVRPPNTGSGGLR
jgi:hypothetical protein